MQLDSSIKEIKGVGDKLAALYNSLDIYTIKDILEYYPRDYELYEAPDVINKGKFDEINTVYGKLCGIPKLHQMNGKKVVVAGWVDVRGNRFNTVWFNQAYLCKTLHTGDSYVLRGKKVYRGVLELVQPQIFTDKAYSQLKNQMVPIYALTAGITRQALIKNLKFVFDNLNTHLSSEIDNNELTKGLMNYPDAVYEIHFPQNRDTAEKARKRIVLEEFYQFLKKIEIQKNIRNNKVAGYPIEPKKETDRYMLELPFSLTSGQEKAWEDIRKDLCSTRPMHRIVQGDVGSGKTILAFLGMLETSLNCLQSVLMAPTAVLAKQHYENFIRLFPDKEDKLVLLTGNLTLAEKRKAYERIELEDDLIIIGTHAVFQERVVFNKLMLVITDEQHRFGVEQRHTLADKGVEPHVLYMSATPIPRTIAGIIYADMDVTVLSEKPAGRTKIHTCVINKSERKKAFSFINKELIKGHQVYVICPLIEESELLSGENVTDYSKMLMDVFPNVNIGVLHGRMKQSEKDFAMHRFSICESKILVSTTVVEVGVDVPNASVIVIENAERFGLAQLHQLRGRVGRGNTESYCILINGTENQEDNDRLTIMNESDDGFEISNRDFKMRGPGDILGIRQSGDSSFILADVYRDNEMLAIAQKIVVAQ